MAVTEPNWRTARERARAEITSEILDAGRRHLATEGASGLSLRAIARELGMASSAVYRYVASRDELLTRLIMDAYNSLGAATEEREAAVDRVDLRGRWAAACFAVRDWAFANPNEYALVYGSPVPGYVAPPDTVGPAARVANVLVLILIDKAERDHDAAVVNTAQASPTHDNPASHSSPTVHDSPLSHTNPVSSTTLAAPAPAAAWRTALEPLRAVIPTVVPDSAIQSGLMTWAGLFGVVSLELFGQFHNVVGENPGDREAFFAECVTRWAAQLGLP
jgi:AcrR family transcriptional regulator